LAHCSLTNRVMEMCKIKSRNVGNKMKNKTSLYVPMAIVALLLMQADSLYASWPQQAKLIAPDGTAYDSFGSSVSISGDYAIVGAYNDDGSGSAYIFKYDGTTWIQQKKLTALDGAAGDNFGWSVSISGDYAIVGADGDDDKGDASGSAYIFKRYGSTWSQQAKLTPSDGAAGDYFGLSVSISGDYAIVGVPNNDAKGADSGSGYIFKYDGTNWSQQAKLTASDGAAGDDFGYSVSISGDYAIVGAYWDDDKGNGSGSAYIFKRDGTNWSEQQKLTASDGAGNDNFGYSVSISGDYAIVGAWGDDDKGNGSGSGYIFKRDGTNWSEQQKLTASDGAASDLFGISVSTSGDYAIVGACGDNDLGSLSGSAYIFKYDGTIWSQQEKITASDGAAGDWFGYSVSMSGYYAIVGAWGDDDKGTDSGSAYIYDGSGVFYSYINGTKWHDKNGNFLKDPEEEALSGWRIYADINLNGQFDTGEPNTLTDASGNYTLKVPPGTWVLAEEYKPCWEQTYPGGNGTYNITLAEDQIVEGYNFGNARLTEIHPSIWQDVQQDKLTASDGAASDLFGISVSTSGDYAIVGAHQDDDKGTNSGSAYIFARDALNCSDWGQMVKLTASDGADNDYFGSSVSIGGNYAIVGSYSDDDKGNGSGSAYIFKYDGTTWSQRQKLTAADGTASDCFAYSVSISGDYAIVGAYLDDDKGTDSGSAYIFFKYDGTTWSQQQKLTASDGAASDNFGYSVSISGDYAIVGSYGDDDKGNGSGSAYIFKRDGEAWVQQAKLTALDGAVGDFFGQSVSISGDYAIVGAYLDDDKGNNSGSAYIFKRSGATWVQQAKLIALDGAAGDYFGYSVSISGDYAIVGVILDDDKGADSGSAYIFKYDGTTWSLQQKWTASDGAANDNFGISVSISGDSAIVGAHFDDDRGSNSGSAYMFGKTVCPSTDLNGDCIIDFKDIALIAGEWLQGTNP